MQKGATPEAAAPATVTGEVAHATGRKVREGGRPLSGLIWPLWIRKPGDLPALRLNGRTGCSATSRHLRLLASALAFPVIPRLGEG